MSQKSVERAVDDIDLRRNVPHALMGSKMLRILLPDVTRARRAVWKRETAKSGFDPAARRYLTCKV